MNNLNLFSDENVPEDWQSGKNRRQNTAVVEDNQWQIEDLKEIDN